MRYLAAILSLFVFNCTRPPAPPDNLCLDDVGFAEQFIQRGIGGGIYGPTGKFPEVVRLKCEATFCIKCPKVLCTATIIGENTIITARHCVECGNYKKVYIERGGFKTLITKIIKHPKKDLALGILSEPQYVKKTTLAKSSPVSGDNILVLGYGGNDLSTDRVVFGCNVISRVVSKEFKYESETGSVSCHGDSGGPTYINGILSGIHYECEKCNICGTGSSFDVRIDTELTWIQKNTDDIILFRNISE